MTFSTRNFDPLTTLSPKFPNFATQIWLFRLKHTVAVVTHAHVLQNFYTTWVLGVACQKNNVQNQNWRGLGQGSIQKFGTPYLFLQPLKLATSKFSTQLGFGTSLPKNNDLDQNWRGSGPGEHPKKCGTCIFVCKYVFLQPLKLTTLNLVHTMGLEVVYQKTTFRTKIGGALGQGSIQKNLGPPT